MYLAELNGTEQQEFTATRLGPGRADDMKPGSYSKCRHRLALALAKHRNSPQKRFFAEAATEHKGHVNQLSAGSLLELLQIKP
jgi:hypothetical protein